MIVFLTGRKSRSLSELKSEKINIHRNVLVPLAPVNLVWGVWNIPVIIVMIKVVYMSSFESVPDI